MPPRREANSLLEISLQGIEYFLQDIIKTASLKIVRYDNERTKQDLEIRHAIRYQAQMKNRNNEYDIGTKLNKNQEKGEENVTGFAETDVENRSNSDESCLLFDEEGTERNYRLEMLTEYVDRLHEYIFSHVPYSLVEDVKSKVIMIIGYFSKDTTKPYLLNISRFIIFSR